MKRAFLVLLLCTSACATPVNAGEEMLTVPAARLKQLIEERSAMAGIINRQTDIIVKQQQKIEALQAATNCV